MKKNVTLLLILLVILAVIAVVGRDHYFYINSTIDSSKDPASVFLVPGISGSDLQNKYSKSGKVNILVVAGHEPNYGGAEYKKLKERDMALELADDLAVFIKNNAHYNLSLSRDDNGWTPDLSNYFNQNWDAIKKFNDDQKAEMNRLISNGKMVKLTDEVYHNKAPTDVALRLYGINKWSNDHAMDINLHIHFNDYPRSRMSQPGDYSGFTIYIPDRQYSNAGATAAVANSVFKRLANVFPVSDYPPEQAGIVEDQDLVAIGSHNSADPASMLIEYGYIYEPQFQNEAVRHAVIKEMAFQTYLGLQDFFGGANDTGFNSGTTLIPAKWPSEITPNSNDLVAGLLLQAELELQGFYPASGDTKNDCPLTGSVGSCTLAALKNFQNKYGITGETGKAGKQTLQKLTDLYTR